MEVREETKQNRKRKPEEESHIISVSMWGIGGGEISLVGEFPLMITGLDCQYSEIHKTHGSTHTLK